MSNAKKLLAVFLACTMLLCAAPMAGFVGLEISDFDFNLSADAAEIVDSGTCGTNVTYTLDSDGVLTIAGTGAMWNSSSPPWYSNRSAIKTVIIENGVTSIGRYAFEDCTSLTSVTIPDSVTSIGISAFSGCELLTSVTIPDSVTSIGGAAFYNCTSLTSVTIPDSVTSIGDGAFSYCDSLGEIVIENKDCQIYDSSNTITVNAVIRGHNDSTAQSYAEKYNRGFVSIDGAGSDIILSGYCGDNADFTLTRGGTLHITGTGAVYSYDPDSARPWYKYCGFIRTVIIEDGITELGDSAFSQFYNLLSVTIPDSVTSIGDSAFRDCTSLTSVTIPDSVTSIGDSAFCDCRSLTSVTISDSVTSIGGSAFSGCTKLTSVTIPDSVTSIGDWAFYYCTSLTSVTIPDSVTSIGDLAFYNCTSLTSVTIFNPNCWIYDSADTISATAVIRGYDDSTAKSYARKYNRTFELLTECTHEKTETIPAVAATCTKGGFTTGTRCAVCRTVLVAPVATPAAHNYTSRITTPATHTTEGVKTFTCSACGDTYTEAVAKIESHDYKTVVTPPTCEDRGFTAYICTCGDVYVADYVGVIPHSFTKYVSDNNATCKVDGTKHAFCDYNCGAKDVIVDEGSKTEHIDNDNDGYCDVDGTELYEHHKCMCHNSNVFIRKFFYPIALCFWKLFGIRQTCECGKVHY